MRYVDIFDILIYFTRHLQNFQVLLYSIFVFIYTYEAICNNNSRRFNIFYINDLYESLDFFTHIIYTERVKFFAEQYFQYCSGRLLIF